ncbi:MAG: type IX secretion system protein PorQ [Melioribacter sp.]|nr:type IX secretion system protein PorQ [Melioribacter sp.]
MSKAKIIFIFLITTNIIFSQTVYKFLELDISPRAAALAGSFVSNNDDPNVIFYNPAGINFNQNNQISISFLKHLLDINSASLAFVKEIKNIGKFSTAIKYINYGDFTKADPLGLKIGHFSASDIAFSLGYGNILGENFYYGINVKFIYSGIESYSSTAYAFDLGLHYEIPDKLWNFGFSVLNLGKQINSYISTKEDLPLDIRLGLSKQLERVPIRFYFSFNNLNENHSNFFARFKHLTFGSEIKLGQSFKLRIGYDSQKRKELKIGTTAGLAGFNIGFGFNAASYVIDYAYSSMGSIGALHRFGISTNL